MQFREFQGMVRAFAQGFTQILLFVALCAPGFLTETRYLFHESLPDLPSRISGDAVCFGNNQRTQEQLQFPILVFTFFTSSQSSVKPEEVMCQLMSERRLSLSHWRACCLALSAKFRSQSVRTRKMGNDYVRWRHQHKQRFVHHPVAVLFLAKLSSNFSANANPRRPSQTKVISSPPNTSGRMGKKSSFSRMDTLVS